MFNPLYAIDLEHLVAVRWFSGNLDILSSPDDRDYMLASSILT